MAGECNGGEFSTGFKNLGQLLRLAAEHESKICDLFSL